MCPVLKDIKRSTRHPVIGVVDSCALVPAICGTTISVLFPLR